MCDRVFVTFRSNKIHIFSSNYPTNCTYSEGGTLKIYGRKISEQYCKAEKKKDNIYEYTTLVLKFCPNDSVQFLTSYAAENFK